MTGPQRYPRRLDEVEAMLVDGNHDAVAAWAAGRVAADRQTGIRYVHLPQSSVPAKDGDWVVRNVLPDGLGPARAMKAVLFEWCYDRHVAG